MWWGCGPGWRLPTQRQQLELGVGGGRPWWSPALLLLAGCTASEPWVSHLCDGVTVAPSVLEHGQGWCPPCIPRWDAWPIAQQPSEKRMLF